MEFFNATYFNRHLIFTALGIAGAVLPLLPAAPFRSGFCFARSSDRFYNWLINQKFIKNM